MSFDVVDARFNAELAKITPIPSALSIKEWSVDWKNTPIDPISDQEDPLVPIGPMSSFDQIATSSIYAGEHANSPYPGGLNDSSLAIFLRKSVAEKLVAAQCSLPAQLRVVVFDGHRMLALQQSLFDTYFLALRDLKPEASEAELILETQNFVSLPSNDPSRPSPHYTGGAVDVAIFDASNNKPRMLDFGTPFDYGLEPAELRFFEEMAEERDLTETQNIALGNRRLLYHVMHHAGLQGFPGEWWHFNAPESQMGAKVAGIPYARFGGIALGEEQFAFEQLRRQNQPELGLPTFLPPASVIKPLAA